jgi:hypothetical protein
VQSEDIIKVRDVGGATVLLGGSTSNSKELLTACTPYILAYPNGGDDLAITKLRQGLVGAVKLRKREVATAALSAQLGLSWDEVSELSKTHPHSAILDDAWRCIKSVQLDAELVVSVFTDDEVALLVIDQKGTVTWADHYAAIGTGSSIASVFLHQREYWDSMSLEECVYRVVEAKTAAEKNPFVGKSTSVEFRARNEMHFVSIDFISKAQTLIRKRMSEIPAVEFEGDFLEGKTIPYPAGS